MAEVAPLKLDAVNEILLAGGQERVAAVDTGGVSYAGKAERELDIALRDVCIEGTDDNTIPYVAIAPAGAGNTVTLPSGTLAAVGVGPTEHRRFAVRGDTLFDRDRNTTSFAGESSVAVRVKLLLAWADCSVTLKSLAIAQATERFIRRFDGNPIRDQLAQLERVRAQSTVGRPLVPPFPQQQWSGPVTLSTIGGGQQGQQGQQQ